MPPRSCKRRRGSAWPLSVLLSCCDPDVETGDLELTSVSASSTYARRDGCIMIATKCCFCCVELVVGRLIETESSLVRGRRLRLCCIQPLGLAQFFESREGQAHWALTLDIKSTRKRVTTYELPRFPFQSIMWR